VFLVSLTKMRDMEGIYRGECRSCSLCVEYQLLNKVKVRALFCRTAPVTAHPEQVCVATV